MAKQTTNVGLTKPEQDEFYDIEVMNQNLDIIDNSFKNHEDRVINLEGKTDAFCMDIEAYYGNTKLIDDGQDLAAWTAITVTPVKETDMQKVKLGNSAIRFNESDTSKGALFAYKNQISLDLSKLSNGHNSTDDDFIYLVAYISKIDAVSTNESIKIGFSQDETFKDDNSKYYNIPKDHLKTGWNYISIPKSAFGTLGTGAWNNIKSMLLLWSSNDNYKDEYVTFQLIQLIKKDPIEAKPNPFQKMGKRALSLNNGEWYVGKEFDQVVVKEISGEDDSRDALTTTSTFSDFVINARCYSGYSNFTSSGYSPYISYILNESNCVILRQHGDELWLHIAENNVAVANYYTKKMSIGVRDVLNIVLEKKGSNLLASMKNETTGETVYLNGTTTLNGGHLGIGRVGASIQSYVLSASVSEIQHAHHSDVSEVAKKLIEQPRARVYSSMNPTIPDSTTTVITFDTVVWDNRKHFDFKYPTRLTIRESGLYSIHVNLAFASNGTGQRYADIRLNGSRVIASVLIVPFETNQAILQLHDDYIFNAGDYIEVAVNQSSGGPLNINSFSYSPIFSITKIG